MPQFFADKKDISGDTAVLRGPEARHASRVMRLGEGDAIQIFDGEGRGYRGAVSAVSGKEVRVRITGEIRSPDPIGGRLVLAQSLIPHEQMDWAVLKGTELGVHGLMPFVSERTIARVAENLRERKREHWQKTALAACKQSGRLVVPEIYPILDFEGLLRKTREFDLVLCADPDPGHPSLGDLLQRGAPPAKIVLIVGPEGGLTEEEVGRIQKVPGAACVTLGPNLLKSETAALYMIAVARHLLQNKK